jgi:hypothetical protein
MASSPLEAFPDLTVEQDTTFEASAILNSSKCRWFEMKYLGKDVSARGRTFPLSTGESVTLSQMRDPSEPDTLANWVLITGDDDTIEAGDFIEWSSEGLELSAQGQGTVERVMKILDEIKQQRPHPSGDVGQL